MVSRTIQIPSGSIVITGTLTEADRIYRLLPKLLLQNGYSLTHRTKTDAPPGNNPTPPSCDHQREIDKLVDENMDLIRQERRLMDELAVRADRIIRLESKVTALENVLANVTGRSD